MNVNKDLVIINNEKISKEKTNFYCDNIDVKSIPEDLDKKFSVTLIARNSKDKRMRQINIENENKRAPQTDEKLVKVLQEKGYKIARRTVAKYREQLNIPVARLRKEI